MFERGYRLLFQLRQVAVIKRCVHSYCLVIVSSIAQQLQRFLSLAFAQSRSA